MVKPDPAVRKIYLRAIAFNLVLIGLWAVVIDNPLPWLKGQVLGGLVGLLMFRQMQQTITRAVTRPPNQANAVVRRGYLIRLVVYGVVFLLSLLSPDVHLIPVLLGVVVPKYTVLLSGLLDKSLFAQPPAMSGQERELEEPEMQTAEAAEQRPEED